IVATSTDSRKFLGYVAKDVRDRTGNLVVPDGAAVELQVREAPNHELVLDVNSITINGHRFTVETGEDAISPDQNECIDGSRRTFRYSSRPPLIGTILSGVSGVTVCGEVVTQGETLHVPANALVTFRITQPLRTPVE